jgi:hypothetical protein
MAISGELLTIRAVIELLTDTIHISSSSRRHGVQSVGFWLKVALRCKTCYTNKSSLVYVSTVYLGCLARGSSKRARSCQILPENVLSPDHFLKTEIEVLVSHYIYLRYIAFYYYYLFEFRRCSGLQSLDLTY